MISRLLCVLAAILTAGMASAQQPADLILHHGKIAAEELRSSHLVVFSVSLRLCGW
jgi:hypothetical protein